MLAKYTIAGLAGSALLATVAFAQSPTTPADTAKAPAPGHPFHTARSRNTTRSRTRAVAPARGSFMIPKDL